MTFPVTGYMTFPMRLIWLHGITWHNIFLSGLAGSQSSNREAATILSGMETWTVSIHDKCSCHPGLSQCRLLHNAHDIPITGYILLILSISDSYDVKTSEKQITRHYFITTRSFKNLNFPSKSWALIPKFKKLSCRKYWLLNHPIFMFVKFSCFTLLNWIFVYFRIGWMAISNQGSFPFSSNSFQKYCWRYLLVLWTTFIRK